MSSSLYLIFSLSQSTPLSLPHFPHSLQNPTRSIQAGRHRARFSSITFDSFSTSTSPIRERLRQLRSDSSTSLSPTSGPKTLRKARHYSMHCRPLFSSYFVFYKTMELPIETMLTPSLSSIRFSQFSLTDVCHDFAIIRSLSRCHFRTGSVHSSEGREWVSNT